MYSDLSIEFIAYLKTAEPRPRVGRGTTIELAECCKCPLSSADCMFGMAAAENIRLGHSKLPAAMCAYRNGFHVMRNE